MQKFASALLLSALVSTAAWAQSNNDQTMTTTQTTDEVSGGLLKDEKIAIRPQVGVIAFTDQLDESTTRGAAGLTVDLNATGFMPEAFRVGYLGITTGAIYSHLGSATSNFFGTNPSSPVTNAGANMLLVPANLKIGWNTGNNSRLSLHGGGNVMYRSVANSIPVGATAVGDSSIWRIFPNAGADFEIGFGNNTALLIRPDVTFTPGNEIFTGTVGLGIDLG